MEAYLKTSSYVPIVDECHIYPVSFNHANGQIVVISQKYHTFSKVCLLKNSLTVDFTQKNHPESITIAVAIGRLS